MRPYEDMAEGDSVHGWGQSGAFNQLAHPQAPFFFSIVDAKPLYRLQRHFHEQWGDACLVELI